jgi:catechol 2,3-dioxygenase-like lactoylglutathione lyase family enzyme
MDRPVPVLNGLNLVVRDMDATLTFYRKLGLEIPDAAIWRTETGAHHVAVSMPNGMDFDFDSPQLARSYNAGLSTDGTSRWCRLHGAPATLRRLLGCALCDRRRSRRKPRRTHEPVGSRA